MTQKTPEYTGKLKYIRAPATADIIGSTVTSRINKRGAPIYPQKLPIRVLTRSEMHHRCNNLIRPASSRYDQPVTLRTSKKLTGHLSWRE